MILIYYEIFGPIFFFENHLGLRLNRIPETSRYKMRSQKSMYFLVSSQVSFFSNHASWCQYDEFVMIMILQLISRSSPGQTGERTNQCLAYCTIYRCRHLVFKFECTHTNLYSTHGWLDSPFSSYVKFRPLSLLLMTHWPTKCSSSYHVMN